MASQQQVADRIWREILTMLQGELAQYVTTGIVTDASNERKVMVRNYEESRPVERLLNCPPGVIVRNDDQVLTINLHGKENIVANLTANRTAEPVDPNAPIRLPDGSFVV